MTRKTRFYGNVHLTPNTARSQMTQIVEEIVQQFSERVGTQITISVEIQASDAKGFDDNLQRSVKENCSVMKFRTAEFDE